MIGHLAGVCWNSPTDDVDKNIVRALDCIDSGHTRVAEFPEVYCVIDEYSARCMRELYTHIVGVTRLQASTRYINYKEFHYYNPFEKGSKQEEIYKKAMDGVGFCYQALLQAGVSKEDCANILPLGMDSKMVWKINLRALIHFMNMRLCGRAYKEIRTLANELKNELAEYSDEWKIIADKYFVPNCVASGKCKEKNSCMGNF